MTAAEAARARLVEEKRMQEEAQEAEPDPDPVADAFADMGMAPTITKTKRHVASNPWEARGPVSSSLAMADSGDAGSAGWDDDGDTLDLRAERCAVLPSAAARSLPLSLSQAARSNGPWLRSRRKLAEQRVAAGRERKRPAEPKPNRLSAVRAP